MVWWRWAAVPASPAAARLHRFARQDLAARGAGGDELGADGVVRAVAQLAQRGGEVAACSTARARAAERGKCDTEVASGCR